MDFHEEVIAVGHAEREWVGASTVRVGAPQGGNCVPRGGKHAQRMNYRWKKSMIRYGMV